MLSDIVVHRLGNNYWPISRKEFERELEAARAKGHNVPMVDYESGIYTREQAIKALDDIGIDKNSSFYSVMSKYRSFPLGNGEELYAISNIVKCYQNSFWEEEYPGFAKQFLELSSIEGEGSYLYEKRTDSVYDADWNDMDKLLQGALMPNWNSFNEFLEWYYGEE